MRLEVIVRNKQVSLALCSGGKKIDQLAFHENNNLSEKLLPQIESLLKKNKIKPKDVKKVTVETDTPESFTTSRIAKAVGKSWNWAFLKIIN